MTLTRIGDYQVTRELGRGAMGVVFEVRHPGIPRPLALKLLRPELAEEVDLARFQREGQLLAKVRHPNVVTVHALERQEEGLVLVTDLVEGQDLDALVRAGGVPAREAAQIVAALADGVAALHREGILHRDLKPANALITPDGTPVLIDFGLALELGGERLTRTGDLVGTPAYMSPEQASGHTSRLGPACDVYGLGAILYALICGRPPFTGVGLLDVLTQITVQGVTPPSHHGEAPPALEVILLRAMAKRPEDRYPDAASLRDALQGFVDEPEAEAREPWRAALAFLGVVLLGLVALIVWAVRRPGPAEVVGAPTPTPTAMAATSAAPAPPRTLREELEAALSVPPGAARLDAWLALAPRLTRLDDKAMDAERLLVKRLRAGPLVRLEAPPRTRLGRAALLPDGRVLGVAATSQGSVLRVWERDGRLQANPRWTRGRVIHTALPLDGGKQGAVFISGRLQVVRIPDLARPETRVLWRVPRSATPQEAGAELRAIACAPRAGLLAVGGEFREVYLIDLKSGATRHVLPGHTAGDVRCLGFTADERYLITVTSGLRPAGVRVYALADVVRDAATARPIGGELINSALELAIAPQGALLAVGNRRGQVWVLDAAQRSEKSVLGVLATEHPSLSKLNKVFSRRGRAHAGEMSGLGFLPDGRLVTIGRVGMGKHYHRNTIRLWDPRTQTQVAPVRKLKAVRPESAWVSADGRLLLLLTGQGYEVWPR